MIKESGDFMEDNALLYTPTLLLLELIAIHIGLIDI